MGAWGAGIYENDDACDWGYELEESTGLFKVEEVIDDVLNNEYIDAVEGAYALVALDVLACLVSKQYAEESSRPEEIENWIAANDVSVSSEMNKKAAKVLQKINSDDSELFDLWSDADELDAWVFELKGLSRVFS